MQASTNMIDVEPVARNSPRHAGTIAPTPIQEVGNAISMTLAPISMAIYMVVYSKYFPESFAILAISVIHAGCSATYHIRCALKLDKERIGNFFHQLDQTMNHAVCAVCAVCLAHQHLAYALPVGLFNLFFAMLLWRPSADASSGIKVYVPLALASLLYLVPLIWIQGWPTFVVGLVNWLVIGACFIISPRLYGFTHMISHLLFIPLSIIVIEAASSLG